MKTKSALNQFLVLLSVVAVCFFVIGLIGTFILSALTGVSLEQMSDLSKLDFTKASHLSFLRGMQAVQFISLFVAPVLICSWLFSRDARSYLGLQAPSNSGYILAGVGVMLVAIPFTGWLGELNRNIPFPPDIASWMQQKEQEAERTITAFLSGRNLSDLLLNLLFIAVFAAVGEELLFRGMVQRLLIKMFRSPWAGILISAALFSAMHMQFYGFLPRFALGVLLGLIYWYSGSLWVAMLAHFVYDAVLVVLAFVNPETVKQENNISLTGLALAGSISLFLVFLLVEWMRRRSVTSFAGVYDGDAVPPKNHPFDFDQNTPE